MKLEGGLLFELYHDGAAVVDVKVHSTRPLQMANFLRGKRATEGLALLGMIYRICNVAQRYAGLSAWRKATGSVAEPALRQAQQLLVKLETVREHLWQLLVVWPELQGEKLQQKGELPLLSILTNEMERALFKDGQGMTPMAQLSINTEHLEQLLARLKRVIEQQVCGMPATQWQKIDTLPQLLAWADQHQTPAAKLIRCLMERQWQSLGSTQNDTAALPVLVDSELEHLFDSMIDSPGRDEFIARPTWQGVCCESNVFTRQAQHKLVASVIEVYGNGLLARLTARVVELVALSQAIQAGAARICLHKGDSTMTSAVNESGCGLAMIEAARGRLIHWMKIENGVIAYYAILAPTEWNFHPQGVAVQGLRTLVAHDEQTLKQQAAMWINAIDPCVSYELRVN